MNTQPTVPPLLAANPRLDRWVGFSTRGRVTVSTGRVEIGQGVLTAMLQIAADELGVAPERILLQSGDTDLTPKVFGEPVFVHDVVLDGMVHARVVRQPRRGAAIASIDEAALRRAAKGPIEVMRHGNFLAILGADETVVEAVAAVAPSHVAWDGVDAINPFQEEARWLLQQPSIDQTIGPAPSSGPIPGTTRYEATYTRMHVAHASVAPSCGLAVYRDGRLTVWTHSQGVYPLRAALARTLKLDPAAVSVKHAQGPGCYGHNGADDAAADAAVIAFHRPGKPVRVRWRREEEFGFEPISPAMVVTVRAALDGAEFTATSTTEIWSGR